MKKKREHAQDILNRNIELRAELTNKGKDLEVSEDARKRAEGSAVANATCILALTEGLRACMQDVKVVVDPVLAKAGASVSEPLLEVDVAALGEWLQSELGLLLHVVDSVCDFGSFGAALGVCRPLILRFLSAHVLPPGSHTR